MARGGWQDRARSLGRKLARILVVLSALAFGAGITGAVWEAREQREFERAGHEPPGDLVDIGGCHLHILCSGTGEPGVLLISGLGETFASWGEFRERIARFTRVCAYDRAGIGWSDPAEGPRTADAAARDLATLLASASPFDGPPIIVGHSIGGLYARRYVRSRAHAAAGLVLIDPTTEALYRTAADWRSDFLFERLWPALGRLGVVRLQFRRAHDELDPDSLERAAGVASGYAAARITASEYAGLEASFTGRPEALDTVPVRVPVVVLSARRASDALDGPDGDDSSVGHVRRASHARLAREAIDGRMIEIDSGHYIHHERPDTVLAVIRRLVERARTALGEST